VASTQAYYDTAKITAMKRVDCGQSVGDKLKKKFYEDDTGLGRKISPCGLSK
jgi:hypothetical protein